MKYLRKIWEYWHRHLGYMATLLILAVISGLIAMTYPIVIGKIIDLLKKSIDKNIPQIDPAIVKLFWILALIVLGRFISGSYPAVRGYMNLLMECDVREKYFNKILDKDYKFQSKFRTGDIVTRLTDDIIDYPKVSWFLCSGIFRAIESGVKLIFISIAMFYLNWRLALMSLAPLPIMVCMFMWIQNRLKNAYYKQQKAVSDVNDILESAFSGIKIIKAFNGENGQKEKLGETLKKRIGIQLNLAKLNMLFHSVDSYVIKMGQVVVIGAGGYMVIKGSLSLGELYSFYIFLEMMSFIAIDLPMFLVGARESMVSFDRLNEVGNYPVVVDLDRKGIELSDIESIEFKNVSFEYDTGAGVHDLSFKVNKGQKVAMIGRVGCGKSILLKMIAGILPPQKGNILINGIDSHEYSASSIFSKLGYVPQEGLLFSESIRDNVDIGREVNNGQIEESLSVSQVLEDVQRMPEKLDTVLGVKGSLISGGQKQRIAIARALANNPKVVLFDDATSSLDSHKEEDFWKAYEEKYKDTITFIVSHRLKTIWMADKVFTMDKGRIVDSGTHKELAKRCKIYNSFLETLKHAEVLES